MKLSTLRDDADTAISADVQAAAELSAAENKKIQTGGDVATTRRAFAHGLTSVGGKVVDTKAAPPKLYVADIDGEGYSVSTLPDIDADAPDPAPTSAA